MMTVKTLQQALGRGTVLVTGSSRGIGRAIAMRLASEGYDIVVHCRSSTDDAHALAVQIRAMGRIARVLVFDVLDREGTAAALTADMEKCGAYYGVVCNAGVARDHAFPAMPATDWDLVVHTNLDAFYNVLNPVVMPMIQRRMAGRIVTLSSIAGLMGNRGQVNYSAAKAGIVGATKALAVELAKRDITCNCVAPGLIDTEMLNATISSEAKAEALAAVPMRRIGTADDVAAAVAFLMHPDAGYITRQVISVNGGMIG